ncbi:DUF4279 domain-containing protein [Listeria booriae]|uniref:DUF4279 domain-containing protein n=1 Tax=Listeria booriae TaxID=1552123 RepID=UPI0016283027|nr:DUF4279 domain-containing protein [Listeria booriae]MBC2259867.1 DUF4279 domain-containing protein [Listeria booriae]
MQKTKIKIEFNVIADMFDLDEFSTAIGMTPDESWLKGEKIKNTNRTKLETCWTICVPYKESFDVNDQLNEFLQRMGDLADRLGQIREDFKVEYLISILITIKENMSPAIYFEKEFLDFLSKSGTTFDIDLSID